MTKILYVDNNFDRINQIQEFLSSEYSLDIAFNGWEGIGAAMLYSPDIMVINLVIPIVDGIEAIRLIRSEKELQTLPIIGFTEPYNQEVEEIALKMGCTKMLSYPINWNEFKHNFSETTQIHI